MHAIQHKGIACSILLLGAMSIGPAMALSQPSIYDMINAEAAKGNIHVHPLRGGLTELEGSGGNITVLNGPDGKFLVDAGIALSRPALEKALAGIGPAPIKYVVNTHWHWDHADGDAWLHQAGATIVATPQTAKHLTEPSRVAAWNHTFVPVPPDGVPSVQLTADKTYSLNGESVLVHPLASSHTDGDISVYFSRADVLATGDEFWNGIYPYIDYEHGGGINGVIDVVDTYLKQVTDHTVIVPGHGPVGNRAQLVEYRDMLVAIRDRVAALKHQGKSLEQVIAAKPTQAFDAKWGQFIITPALFTKLVYNSL